MVLSCFSFDTVAHRPGLNNSKMTKQEEVSNDDHGEKFKTTPKLDANLIDSCRKEWHTRCDTSVWLTIESSNQLQWMGRHIFTHSDDVHLFFHHKTNGTKQMHAAWPAWRNSMTWNSTFSSISTSCTMCRMLRFSFLLHKNSSFLCHALLFGSVKRFHCVLPGFLNKGNPCKGLIQHKLKPLQGVLNPTRFLWWNIWRICVSSATIEENKESSKETKQKNDAPIVKPWTHKILSTTVHNSSAVSLFVMWWQLMDFKTDNAHSLPWLWKHPLAKWNFGQNSWL